MPIGDYRQSTSVKEVPVLAEKEIAHAEPSRKEWVEYYLWQGADSVKALVNRTGYRQSVVSQLLDEIEAEGIVPVFRRSRRKDPQVLRDLVILHLKKNPDGLLSAEVAALLGVSDQNAYRVLVAMCRDGLVCQGGSTRQIIWRLAEGGVGDE